MRDRACSERNRALVDVVVLVDDTASALRRIDLYAARVCRELGLEVPVEWRMTPSETVASVQESLQQISGVFSNLLPVATRMRASFDALAEAWMIPRKSNGIEGEVF